MQKVGKGIKSLSADDRPREKLMLKGRSALSDAELIAILIGSGNAKESAIQLAQRILKHLENNISLLGKMDVAELKQFKGIGEAKAINIIAAMELGRRRKQFEKQEIKPIRSSKNAFDIFYPVLSDLRHEEFHVLLLNRANKVMKQLALSKGGVTGTVVDVKLIMKSAIEQLATGVILGHNHPSGNLNPSGEDLTLTKKIKEAGKLLDIQLFDHLIIGDNAYFSFADEGIL